MQLSGTVCALPCSLQLLTWSVDGPIPTLPQQDMWAMGVTLYEVLSWGDYPWGLLDSTPQEMIAAIRACPPDKKVQQLAAMGCYSVGLQVRGAGGGLREG
jgi:hypothetical protein